MKATDAYAKAKQALSSAESELSQNCLKMVLCDISPVQCATYVTDELERFMIKYVDNMSMTHIEIFTLMCMADRMETRLYAALGVPKLTR